MTEEAAVQRVLALLQTRRSAEFRAFGKRYLIEPDSNKGCDYLSLWRVSPPAVCLGRALYDVFDGVDEAAVRELLRIPCIEGQSCLSLLASGEPEWE